VRHLIDGILSSIRITGYLLLFVVLCGVWGIKGILWAGSTLIVAYHSIPWAKKIIDRVLNRYNMNRVFFLWLGGIAGTVYIFGTYGESIIFYAYIVLMFLEEHYAFIFSCILLSIVSGLVTGFIVSFSKNGYTLKREKNKSNISYELATVNDAIVKELMRLRLDVVELKINQEMQAFKKLDKDMKPSWLAYPIEFATLYRMYQGYPDSAVCNFYNTPSGDYAGIIILLDYTNDPDHPSEYNVEKLRKINAHKRNKIAEGDTVRVHLFDPEDIGDKFMARNIPAKVLSIQHIEDWSSECDLTLEIEIDDGDDGDRQQSPTTIIRKIRLSDRDTDHFKN
jgi:hypothetical protein